MHSYKLQLHVCVLEALGQGWGAYNPRAHLPPHPRPGEAHNAIAPSKGSPCSRVPQFSGSLGNIEPQVHIPLGFLFNLLYSFGGNILVPGAFCLPGVGGRRQVQKKPIQFRAEMPVPRGQFTK